MKEIVVAALGLAAVNAHAAGVTFFNPDCNRTHSAETLVNVAKSLQPGTAPKEAQERTASLGRPCLVDGNYTSWIGTNADGGPCSLIVGTEPTQVRSATVTCHPLPSEKDSQGKEPSPVDLYEVRFCKRTHSAETLVTVAKSLRRGMSFHEAFEPVRPLGFACVREMGSWTWAGKDAAGRDCSFVRVDDATQVLSLSVTCYQRELDSRGRKLPPIVLYDSEKPEAAQPKKEKGQRGKAK